MPVRTTSSRSPVTVNTARRRLEGTSVAMTTRPNAAPNSSPATGTPSQRATRPMSTPLRGARQPNSIATPPQLRLGGTVRIRPSAVRRSKASLPAGRSRPVYGSRLGVATASTPGRGETASRRQVSSRAKASNHG